MTMPIPRLLRQLALVEPDRPAVTCGEETRTRQELELRSNRLARAYDDLGVTPGAMVTIGLANGVEHVEATLAVLKLGAIPQVVSHRLPATERQAIVDLADPVLLVGVDADEHPGRHCLPEGYLPPADLSDAAIEPDRVAPAWKAMTSGGSTGRPKLIVSGLSSDLDPQLGVPLRMRPGGALLTAGPLYHNAGFLWSWYGLFLGKHVVVLPRFDAAAALEAIERHRIDWINLVPTMMSRIARLIDQDPARFDLSSLEVVWHMAAPCPPWLKERWIELVGPEALMELYGGTEGQATTTISGTEWLEHRGSVGRSGMGEVRVLRPDLTPADPGEVGEVYLRRPEGMPPTYRYVGAEAKEHDGWESLGDLGWMDADGYLYLSDRRVDLIVAGGANVYPAEVEAVLVEHPAVGSAIVVGLPDEDLGQRVHAVVQAEAPVTVEELLRFVGERLVRYKVPRSIRIVDEPLRDDAGKARRIEVRDQEIARSS